MTFKHSIEAPALQAEKRKVTADIDLSAWRQEIDAMAPDHHKEQMLTGYARLYRVYLESVLLESVIECREHFVNSLKGRNDGKE